MKKMTRKQYNEWINKMYIDFNCSSFTMKLCKDARTIIVVSKHGNRIGKATCHKNDNFSNCTGTAIAYARAIGQEIPVIVNEVKVNSLCYGNKFIYANKSYIYVAKHPTKSSMHMAVSERNGMTYEFLESALVEKV